MPKSTVIAICGKGGSGKTCVSALLTRILIEDGKKKLLAIDADPSAGLASALGIRVDNTVDDIRNRIIKNIKDENDKKELIAQLDYEVFNAIAEQGNLAFLAIGRPEKQGCYCKVNNFLKDIIKEIAGRFDYVIIDGEAGIEQVNRRVMENVTNLLLITDTSARGRSVAETIANVAKRAIKHKKLGLLINKARNRKEAASFRSMTKLPVIGWIPDDDIIRRFDQEGRTAFDIPSCAALKALRKMKKYF